MDEPHLLPAFVTARTLRALLVRRVVEIGAIARHNQTALVAAVTRSECGV